MATGPRGAGQPLPPLRIRWGRVAALVTVLVLLAAFTIRTATADPGRPPADDAGGAAAPAPPATTSPASGCPHPDRTTVHHAPGVPGGGRTVALTFDDGPGEWTPRVLEVLRRHRVPATFFTVGRRAAAEPELLRAVLADGHLVGNHTWSHEPPRSGRWQYADLAPQLRRTEVALRRATGRGSCWFRPPEGVLAGAHDVLRGHGIAMALWSVDTRDWAVQRGTAPATGEAYADDDAVKAIRAAAAAGLRQDHPVLLLHDGGGYRGATVAALPAVIQTYRDAGYTFVRLDAVAGQPATASPVTP